MTAVGLRRTIMSAQRCPKCGVDAFTWSIDEEISPLTIWHCSVCLYRAEEDESLEHACEECGDGQICLRDDAHEYRFCLGCGREALL